MAYVKVGSHSSATACLTYGEYKNGKRRDNVVIGGVNCRASSAKEEFKTVRYLWNKLDGIQAHTVIQSFDDNLTMEQANELGQIVAKRLAPNHQAVVFTHNDGEGGKIHNHIVINSVSMTDGKKLCTSGFLYKARNISNEVSREHGLNVIKEMSAALRYTQAEKGLIAKGERSWKDDIREVVDNAKQKCKSEVEFKTYLG